MALQHFSFNQYQGSHPRQYCLVTCRGASFIRPFPRKYLIGMHICMTELCRSKSEEGLAKRLGHSTNCPQPSIGPTSRTGFSLKCLKHTSRGSQILNSEAQSRTAYRLPRVSGLLPIWHTCSVRRNEASYKLMQAQMSKIVIERAVGPSFLSHLVHEISRA